MPLHAVCCVTCALASSADRYTFWQYESSYVSSAGAKNNRGSQTKTVVGAKSWPVQTDNKMPMGCIGVQIDVCPKGGDDTPHRISELLQCTFRRPGADEGQIRSTRLTIMRRI